MSTPTLFVALIVVCATIALSSSVVALRQSRETAIWAAAFGANSLAFLLVALRGQVSDFLSVIVGNVALTTGFALFIKGIWSFQRLTRPSPLVWLPIPVVAIAFIYFLDNIQARLLIISSTAAMQALYCFFALWHGRKQTAGRGQFVAMAGFLVVAPAFLGRVAAAASGQIESILSNNWMQAATLLSGIASLLLIGTGFISMVQERAEHELAKSRETLGNQHLKLKEFASALQSANRRLTELSITDSLTGLANRRHFDEVLNSEWARAQRQKKTLTLFMLDVDFFKPYNDRYGHQAGDECLKRLALVLRSSLRRPDDLVARYGGEEFAIIATDLDRSKSVDFANRLCRTVSTLSIPHQESPYHAITVSIGVSCVTPDDSGNAASLIKSADGALYLAKNAGRNCVREAVREFSSPVSG